MFLKGVGRKFQHLSSSRFGDIPEKPEGWMKTTSPPPLPLMWVNRYEVLDNSRCAKGIPTSRLHYV